MEQRLAADAKLARLRLWESLATPARADSGRLPEGQPLRTDQRRPDQPVLVVHEKAPFSKHRLLRRRPGTEERR